MDLFNRNKKEKKDYKFLRLNFDKLAVDKSLTKIGEELFSMRNSETSKVFVSYLELMRNKVLLELASGKDSVEYSYRKGQFDSLTYILQTRQHLIEKTKMERQNADRKSKVGVATRSYIKKKTSAGLSI